MRLLVAAAFVAVLAWPSNAWAYIDPGAGSAAYQLLLPILVGAGMLLRRAWQRLLAPHRTKSAHDLIYLSTGSDGLNQGARYTKRAVI